MIKMTWAVRRAKKHARTSRDTKIHVIMKRVAYRSDLVAVGIDGGGIRGTLTVYHR